MQAAWTAIVPVLAVIALGWIARNRNWLSQTQMDGACDLVIHILFPILIFSLMCQMQLQAKDLSVVTYVVLSYLCIGWIGQKLARRLAPRYAHFAGFLLMTNEGGNIALPLFLSIVGTSSITVVFDLAVILVNFVILPVLIESMQARAQHTPDTETRDDLKGLLQRLLTNPFLIAATAGLLCSMSGAYSGVIHSAAGSSVVAVLHMLTSPIIPIILFSLGYNLQISSDILKPLLKMTALKTVLYGLVIAGFYIGFPNLMHEAKFALAVFIYFMSPTSFGLIPTITPLYKTKEDAAFTSSFTSIYLPVTLIVFAAAALIYQ